METLTSGRVADVLGRLHSEADAADAPMRQRVMAEVAASGQSLEEFFADKVARDKQAPAGSRNEGMADHFLAVSPSYGRFLYTCARATRATRIVEFGSLMGLSAIYLAAALRDNGGGQLIGSEIEPTKVARAGANIEAAGLAAFVDIREGDANETLRDVGGTVDLLMLDGAFTLYVPILKLIEPRLRPGAFVLAENALDRDYLDYVRDPANGYVSQPVVLDDPRGNEVTVRTR